MISLDKETKEAPVVEGKDFPDKEMNDFEEAENTVGIQANDTDTNHCVLFNDDTVDRDYPDKDTHVCVQRSARENMYTLHKSGKFIHRTYELSEKDFYPPEDTRTWRSGVMDVPHGDSFEEYSSWFYETYEDDLFDN